MHRRFCVLFSRVIVSVQHFLILSFSFSPVVVPLFNKLKSFDSQTSMMLSNAAAVPEFVKIVAASYLGLLVTSLNGTSSVFYPDTSSNQPRDLHHPHSMDQGSCVCKWPPSKHFVVLNFIGGVSNLEFGAFFLATVTQIC